MLTLVNFLLKVFGQGVIGLNNKIAYNNGKGKNLEPARVYDISVFVKIDVIVFWVKKNLTFQKFCVIIYIER